MQQAEGIVGLALRDARLRRGWTLHDLAATTGIDVGTLGQIERGRRQPSPRTSNVLRPVFPEIKNIL